jgi:hypothetical protein
MHQYTLTLPERAVQLLVEQLRNLPHREVDEELQSIRRQCVEQEQAAAAKAREQLRAEVAAEMEEAARAAEVRMPLRADAHGIGSAVVPDGPVESFSDALALGEYRSRRLGA